MIIQILLLLLVPAIGLGFKSDSGSDSLLDGLTNLVLSLENATELTQLTACQRQLLTLHEARQRREAWALKAFDASGSGYDDFMLGNSLWLGSSTTCRAVNENVMRFYTITQKQLLQSFAPFPFDYHVAYIKSNSPWQMEVIAPEQRLLHFGLCVPQSCTKLEIEKMLHQVLDSETVSTLQKFDMKPELIYTKQPQLKGDFLDNKSFKLLMALFGCVGLLTLLATCGMISGRIFSCFDAYSNWQRLSKVASQEIAVINGFRVISAVSILILHISWYTSQSIDQSADLAMKIATIWLYHPYLPGMLEVFFTISGFLTVSNFLANETLQRSILENSALSNLSSILKQLLHRYLRLVPMQLLVILCVIVGFSYYREVSVFHIVEPMDEICTQKWWQNLFLIQNFYKDSMCANWTWSLACDMQTHLLAILLLFLYTRHPNFVRRLVLALLCCNIVYSMGLFLILDMKPKFDTVYKDMTTYFYFNPFIRSMPYIIGSIYGYAHARKKDSPIEVLLPNKWVKSVLAVAILWLFNELQTEQMGNPVLIACGIIAIRTLISATVAHLILVSFKIEQSAAIIRWLVNLIQANCWQFIGRVTFAFYLLNPLVIYCFNYNFGNVLPSDISILFLLTIAYSVIVLVLSVVLTLFFEIPTNRLTSLLLSSVSPKNKQN